MSLEGHVALVTGASRGIGRGIALQLAKAGAAVYITGRSQATVETAAAAIGSAATTTRGSCTGVVCDHSDDADVQALLNRIAAERDCLDILVNK